MARGSENQSFDQMDPSRARTVPCSARTPSVAMGVGQVFDEHLPSGSSEKNPDSCSQAPGHWKARVLSPLALTQVGTGTLYNGAPRLPLLREAGRPCRSAHG